MSGSWTGGGGHGSAPAHSLPGHASGAAPTRIATLDPEQRYRRIGLLGEGGMGRVWLAWDERLARNVAVKEPAGPRAAAAAALLRHEALIAARLEHPGIVVVHDVIDADPPLVRDGMCAGRSARRAAHRARPAGAAHGPRARRA